MNLPSRCTATLALAPILAIHSRNAEMVISRPMMISEMKASTRLRSSSTISAAQTISLSATGSRNAPKAEVWFQRRASHPSNQSVRAAIMNAQAAKVSRMGTDIQLSGR
ncbi:Uncharacterised protein [Bordetella pertussis]|nr:Uncharacterised protein [Bordetella pertussis]CPN01957.1 Uncharacterised protein [Bordetella pertussis]